MIPPQNVSEAVYRREVATRIGECRKLVEAGRGLSPQVRLVVLSCKRPTEFTRLIESLRPLKVQERVGFETLLVDNGSGDEVKRVARASGFFDKMVFFRENKGMGKAINYALEH